AQPFNALRVTLSSNYSYNWRRQDQYVRTIEAPQGTRTIVGQVSQNTLRFTGRLTFNLTPDLTVQYYGQPFITRPVYRHFAYVTNPLARRYDDRFRVFGANQITLVGDSYEVDEDADGNAEYRFRRPDFNFVQFRSNFVVRWEYKAGSELYLVWAQGSTAEAAGELDTPLAGSLWDNAFAGGSRNSFLIKWTYRFLK
ncbi:MAG: hydrolase, partial [Cytophagales bacterium]|nr:hydrolase [Cytophagales bacterium]